jgi:hypothetical protein
VSQRRGSKRGTGWKPPRDRKEVATAVLAALAVIVVTAALVWFLRPNRNSGSSSTPETVTTPTTLPSTSLPSDSTVAPTTAPAATSTP